MKRYLLTAFLLMLVLTGCKSKAEKPGELSFLMLGKEPQGFSEVICEAEKRTAHLGITKLNFEFIEDSKEFTDTEYVRLLAGKDYDIVYDSTDKTYYHLSRLAVYADITDDIVNNPACFALKELYPDTVWNKIKKENDGKIYGIPHNLMYGDSMDIVYYRADFAREWGMEIKDIDGLAKYLDKCLAQNGAMTPISSKESTGLKNLFGEDIRKLYDNGIVKYEDYYILLTPDKKAVEDIVYKSEPEENFFIMPQAVRDDKLLTRYRAEDFIRWNKYLDPDKERKSEPMEDFINETACAYVGNLTDYPKIADSLPESLIGTLYVTPEITDFSKKRLSRLNFTQFTCIVERSKKKELALKFLCWLMSDRENTDLFSLGIKGRDYELSGDTYNKLSDYGFKTENLTMHPEYSRLRSSMKPEFREVTDHYRNIENSDIHPLAGFVFDKTKVTKELNKIQAAEPSKEKKNDYANGRISYHELYPDTVYEKIKKPLDEYKAELKYQIESYLKTG